MQSQVNIGLFGCVSVGKSTFLNLLAGHQLSDSEIKKTTMVPQIYVSDTNTPDDVNSIREKNSTTNNEISEIIASGKFSTDLCQPIIHKIANFQYLSPDDISITIYDIPGLNDSISKNIYFDWVKSNIRMFDIAIFMTDLNHGLNTREEIEILQLLMKSVKKYNSRLLCLINKCDDIYFDNEINDLVFEEVDQEEIYLQANSILTDLAIENELSESSYSLFYPLSAEKCFIYNTIKDNYNSLDQIFVDRICRNEYGCNQWRNSDDATKFVLYQTLIRGIQSNYNCKIIETGFPNIQKDLHYDICKNVDEFAINRLNNGLELLSKINLDDIDQCIVDLTSYKVYQNQFISINENSMPISDGFWDRINHVIDTYVKTNIVQSIETANKNLVSFATFESIYNKLLVRCENFYVLHQCLRSMSGYENSQIPAIKTYINLIINLYDQIIRLANPESPYLYPINILQYVKTIYTYIPDEFDASVVKFLQCCSQISLAESVKYFENHQHDVYSLMVYVYKNMQQPHLIHKFIALSMLNNQNYILTKWPEYSFRFLSEYKPIIKCIMAIPEFGLLYQITKKNISSAIGSNNLWTNHKLNINIKRTLAIIDNLDVDVESMINLDANLVSVICQRLKIANTYNVIIC